MKAVGRSVGGRDDICLGAQLGDTSSPSRVIDDQE